MMNWPPNYRIKKNRLAKRVNLRINPKTGLVVTVPYRFALKHVPQIVEEHKNWIVEQIAKIASKTVELPQIIAFGCNETTWSVHYLPCDKRLSLHVRPDHELLLLGNQADEVRALKLLRLWVRECAEKILGESLHALSLACGLPFNHFTIRDQQTRWGSCSSAKEINLNARLVFLPKTLMRHVLIHELCHTKVLNHSADFWQLVAKYDNDYLVARKALKRADIYVPAWY